MKLHNVFVLLIIIGIVLVSCNKSDRQGSAETGTKQDSIYTAMLIQHLRTHFDDIHDVSMRFHHLDHRLNGIIQLQMHWENGRMVSSSVGLNETNNNDFPQALLVKIRKWHIEELTGPFDITLPLRIQIVGMTDSTFSEKGILTGMVTDIAQNPIHNAQIQFSPLEPSTITITSCYSNREGIFVRTLIPPGKWNIECRAPGYKKVVFKNLIFQPGEHMRKAITLTPEKPEDAR